MSFLKLETKAWKPQLLICPSYVLEAERAFRNLQIFAVQIKHMSLAESGSLFYEPQSWEEHIMIQEKFSHSKIAKSLIKQGRELEGM